MILPNKLPTVAPSLFLTKYFVFESKLAKEEDKETVSSLNHSADIKEAVMRVQYPDIF